MTGLSVQRTFIVRKGCPLVCVHFACDASGQGPWALNLLEVLVWSNVSKAMKNKYVTTYIHEQQMAQNWKFVGLGFKQHSASYFHTYVESVKNAPSCVPDDDSSVVTRRQQQPSLGPRREISNSLQIQRYEFVTQSQYALSVFLSPNFLIKKKNPNFSGIHHAMIWTQVWWKKNWQRVLWLGHWCPGVCKIISMEIYTCVHWTTASLPIQEAGNPALVCLHGNTQLSTIRLPATYQPIWSDTTGNRTVQSRTSQTDSSSFAESQIVHRTKPE